MLRIQTRHKRLKLKRERLMLDNKFLKVLLYSLWLKHWSGFLGRFLRGLSGRLEQLPSGTRQAQSNLLWMDWLTFREASEPGDSVKMEMGAGEVWAESQ